MSPPRAPFFENKFTTGNVSIMLTILVAVGGAWVAVQRDTARHDEQIADLRAKVAEMRNDHDLLIRIDAKLANLLDHLARQRASTDGKGSGTLQ